MNRFSPLQRLLLTWILIVISGWLAIRVGQLFGHLLTNILTAAVLAFLLNYPVQVLRRYRVSRALAVTLVFALSVVLLVLVGIAVVPVLAKQVVQLGARIPDWVDTLQNWLNQISLWAAERNINLPFGQTELVNTLLNRLQASAEKIAGQSLDLLLGTFNQVIDLVLVLVLALYMLLYGGQFWHGLLSLFPQPWGPRIGEALTLSFQNFLISQLVLGFIMALMLVPVFGVLRVPFGLLFGLLIGLLEVIPLVGGVIGIGAAAVLLAFQDIWLSLKVVLVSLIVQQIKDRVIAPRLMGELIGLNPVWILIALLVGAQLGGILGVIIAIPLTSVVKSIYEISRSADLVAEGGLSSGAKGAADSDNKVELYRDPSLTKPETKKI
ncbi:AI-2E family transporter [Thermostichus vulcanus]|uniref:AI-2E family transporter n=1 Tax=Thermostichus vulcanus str. 'Rupite' TaxID=2813851 RepID=A0ABT0CEN5_THEVL|nr:AI-2E family transporter [Thermostichus vulcanus]MCJ2543805.1 AI-2E family transporter [Thermostichus vulcanus str. 'Rupite']